MKKKKEVVEAPKKWYHKLKTINWSNVLLSTLLISFTAFAVKSSIEIRKAVKKEEVNNYVCQIVGSDQEVGILALKCMTK